MAQTGSTNGAWWRRLLRRLGVGGEPVSGKRRPIVSRGWRHVSLQFTPEDAQSRMLRRHPDHLLVDYTRTMMGALVFQPSPADIGLVGLGGGSQAKYCHRHLTAARIEAIEVNPHVIALRRRFKVPDDDARFRVVEADAAALLPERRGAYDLLLVDGYDETGLPEALSTDAFYTSCRAALRPGGVLATNLYCDDVAAHLSRLKLRFEGRVLVLEEPRMSNLVAFAWVGDGVPASRIELGQRLERLPSALRMDLQGVFSRVANALVRDGRMAG